MILVLNICREKLHYFEFVKPVEDILRKAEVSFFTKSYKDLHDEDLKNASKIIICGTSLKDNDFMKDVSYFLWLRDCVIPVLGICGGMQIIGLVFEMGHHRDLGAKNISERFLLKSTEIGYFHERFNSFLGLDGEEEVYHLHNYSVSEWGKDFEVFSWGKIVQAVKHREKSIYGVLFHPEVRQKEMVLEFVKNE